jgi:hypothetical protein
VRGEEREREGEREGRRGREGKRERMWFHDCIDGSGLQERGRGKENNRVNNTERQRVILGHNAFVYEDTLAQCTVNH